MMCYSKEDDTLWHDDPYEFIRQKYGEGRRRRRRRRRRKGGNGGNGGGGGRREGVWGCGGGREWRAQSVRFCDPLCGM